MKKFTRKSWDRGPATPFPFACAINGEAIVAFLALHLLLSAVAGLEASAQAITVDQVSSASGDVQVLSWPHTVNAGPFRILIVGVSIGDGITATVGSETYGGTALTKINATNHVDGWNRSSGSHNYDVFGGGSTEPGQASVTMSWTLGAARAWVIGGVVLKPAPYPDLTVSKASAVISDPVNSASNPNRLPNSEVLYTIQVTNQGSGPADANRLIITEPVPADTKLAVGNLDGAAGPVKFTDGSPSSGLSYTFTSLASATDNLEFSNNGGASYAYTPTPDGDGCDATVIHFRAKPQGSMSAASGGQNPSFTMDFKVRVK